MYQQEIVHFTECSHGGPIRFRKVDAIGPSGWCSNNHRVQSSDEVVLGSGDAVLYYFRRPFLVLGDRPVGGVGRSFPTENSFLVPGRAVVGTFFTAWGTVCAAS